MDLLEGTTADNGQLWRGPGSSSNAGGICTSCLFHGRPSTRVRFGFVKVDITAAKTSAELAALKPIKDPITPFWRDLEPTLHPPLSRFYQNYTHAAQAHFRMNTSMEDNITYVEITAWTPSYVTTILATGSEHYIGFVDETTVLKYPHLPNESDGITVEAQILRRLSPHPRIIEFKGKTNEGILIERAANGSVADHLFGKDGAAPELLPHPRERLRWAREAAEAVAYIHSKHVIHRDISVGNLLLDKDMHIKLADFQGLLLNPDGTTEAEGTSWEGTRSSMPRENKDQSDARTDIFALGSSIYTIMLQRVPYHDLDSRMDEDEIERRFRQGEFPSIEVELGGEVVHMCWRGDYNSAEELVADLVKLELSSSVESTRDDSLVSGMISTDETGDTCRLSVPNLMPITVNQS